MKGSGMIRPFISPDRVPECSMDCPSRNGGRCDIQNCEPGLNCRPGFVEEIDRLTKELAETKKQLEELRPFQEMLREGNFQMVSNLLTGLTALLIASMGTDNEVMTDFIIKTKDGSKHDLIRLWASHGKTPVERVHELVEERKESQEKHRDLLAKHEKLLTMFAKEASEVGRLRDKIADWAGRIRCQESANWEIHNEMVEEAGE